MKVYNDEAPEEEDDDWQNLWLLALFLKAMSTMFLILTIPISIFFIIKVVKPYERAVVLRMGRIQKGDPEGPGLIFINPFTDNLIKVTIRTMYFDIPPQKVITKDSVTVEIDAVVYYRVSDPKKVVLNIANYPYATRLVAATTIRNELGAKTLHEILEERKILSRDMKAVLDEITDEWGIQVEKLEIKDALLPAHLQRSMAAEAEASREARAKVIAAEGELKASKAFTEAAEVLEESPSSLQLRYLDTMRNIASERCKTIIIPTPVNLISRILSLWKGDEHNRHTKED